MLPVSIPLSIAAALPFAGQIASSLLTDDRQKPGVNAVIAGFFLLAVAVLCAWLAGNFAGNWTLTLAVVLAYCGVLMRGSLGMLMQFFDLTPSPIANAIFGKPQATQPAPAAPPLVVQRANTPPVTPRPAQRPPQAGG